jgi:hypothetical protein
LIVDMAVRVAPEWEFWAGGSIPPGLLMLTLAR